MFSLIATAQGVDAFEIEELKNLIEVLFNGLRN